MPNRNWVLFWTRSLSSILKRVFINLRNPGLDFSVLLVTQILICGKTKQLHDLVHKLGTLR